MIPRPTARLVLLRRTLAGVFARSFTRSSLRNSTRSQTLLLLQPAKTKQQVRWKITVSATGTTVQPGFWQEFKETAWYVSHFAASAVLIYMLMHVIDQERIERWHPSPDEWTFWTRYNFRMATQIANPREPGVPINWIAVLSQLGKALDRMENPDLDGLAVIDLASNDIPESSDIADRNIRPKDISATSDEWRRGYFSTLMTMAKAAEYSDGWLWDRTQNVNFPPEVVVGPSNLNPKPLPKVPKAIVEVPREENCEPAKMPTAKQMYDKIFKTIGFTAVEKMEAAIQYATFLEYKNKPQEALAMLQRALDLANQARASFSYSSSTKNLPYDPETFVILDGTKPSANHLKILTSIATLKARQGDSEKALPILVSILRARRQLPSTNKILDYPRRKNVEKPDSLLTTWERLERFFGPPPYPGRFISDGSTQVPRDAAEMCEEAALNAYIGEIMFSTGSYEPGLAWTREAVDIAEDEIHNIRSLQLPVKDPWFPETAYRDELQYRKKADKQCRECFETGLANWQGMVAKMAAMEEEKAMEEEEKDKKRWIPWGSGKAAAHKEIHERWEEELKLVEERKRKAANVLNTDIWRTTSWFEQLFNA